MSVGAVMAVLTFACVVGIALSAAVDAPSTAATTTGAFLNDTALPGSARALIPWLTQAGSLCPQITAPLLAAQIEQESSWNPNAISAAGAEGIAQFLPATWPTWSQPPATTGPDTPFNAPDAVMAQGRYMCALAAQLAPLAQQTGLDDVSLALAAYNAGPAEVIAAQGIPQNGQTPQYVERILAGEAVYTTVVSATGSGWLGVYDGNAGPGGIAAFDQLTGTTSSWTTTFFPRNVWPDEANPNYYIDAGKATGLNVDYSVPILVPGTSLEEGAAGAFDAHFRNLAVDLVADGEPDATLRLGWEFTGAQMPWSAQGDPAAYSAYWRQIVTTMRSVAGQDFRFDWNGGGSSKFDPVEAYPGDGFVDYVTADIYDQSWAGASRYGNNDPTPEGEQAAWDVTLNGPYGLAWLKPFAAAHGKPIGFPEWGLDVRPDGHGGGDDPYFIQQIFDFMTGADTAFEMYFQDDANDGRHDLQEFPEALAEYRATFGTVKTTSAPAGASAFGLRIVEVAEAELGIAYSWGGGNIDGPSTGIAQGAGTVGFDCSGLALFAVYQASGGTVQLPHSSEVQVTMGTPETAATAEPGDLVFYALSGGTDFDHEGIVLGDGKYLDAPFTGEDVRVDTIVTGVPTQYRRFG